MLMLNLEKYLTQKTLLTKITFGEESKDSFFRMAISNKDTGTFEWVCIIWLLQDPCKLLSYTFEEAEEELKQLKSSDYFIINHKAVNSEIIRFLRGE